MEPVQRKFPVDVLIVEDDPIIAIDFQERVLAFGVARVRTASTVTAALATIGERRPDFALLDIELNKETSFAIAEQLNTLAIPFVFVTGYGAEVRAPAQFAGRPRLQKPCSNEMLEAALKRTASEEN